MESINPKLPVILLAATIRRLSLPESYECIHAYFGALYLAYTHIREEKVKTCGEQPKCINDIIGLIDTNEMSVPDIADLNNLAARFLRYLIHEILSAEQIDCLNIKIDELLLMLKHKLPIAPEHSKSETTNNESEQYIRDLHEQQASDFTYALQLVSRPHFSLQTMIMVSTIEPISETDREEIQLKSYLLGNIVAHAFKSVYNIKTSIDIMTEELGVTIWEIIIIKLKELCRNDVADFIEGKLQGLTYHAATKNNNQAIINKFNLFQKLRYEIYDTNEEPFPIHNVSGNCHPIFG